MKKGQSYYIGALDALKKVDAYLQEICRRECLYPAKMWLADEIAGAVDCISTEFAVENAKRRGDWPTD